MTAPTIREVVSGIGAPGAILTLETGSGTAVDDLLVVFYGTDWDTEADMSAPTGTAGTWTLRASGDSGANEVHLRVYTRFVTVSGAQTVQLSGDTGNDSAAYGTVFVLSGVDTSTPVEDAAGAQQAAASVSHVAPSVTAASSDPLLLCGWMGGTGASGTPYEYTAFPAGMTQRSNNGDPPFAGQGTASEVLSASGATGTKTATFDPSQPCASGSIIVASATSGVPNIAPDGIASAESVPDPTVTRGAVSVTPNAITSGESVPSPAVTMGVVVTPAAIASAESVPAPTIVAVAVTVAPTGIASAESVPAPAVDVGLQTLSPTVISSAESVPAPTVGGGAPTRWDSLAGIGPIGRGGSPFGWVVYLRRNSDLARLGQLTYRQLDLTVRFNDVGSWALTLDPTTPLATNLTDPAFGIEVVRDGTAILSGPMTSVRSSRDGDTRALEVSGPDDMVWLRRRLAHPEPASTAPPYNTAEFDVRSGTASTVLREYVNVNAGPGAITSREAPGLTLEDDPLVGGSVTGRARWQNLLELLSELALAGGGLGFRIRQHRGVLVFEVYQPTDKSNTIHFSYGNGSLRGHNYELTGPEVSYTVVGGGGEGTARVVHEQQGAGAVDWGRIEEFVDQRHATDAGELEQAATEALAERGETTGLSITPVDIDGQTFVTHYDLGDRVSAVVDDVTVQELIREVTITLSGDRAELVQPSIGTPGRKSVLSVFDKVRRLSKQVTNLERR